MDAAAAEPRGPAADLAKLVSEFASLAAADLSAARRALDLTRAFAEGRGEHAVNSRLADAPETPDKLAASGSQVDGPTAIPSKALPSAPAPEQGHQVCDGRSSEEPELFVPVKPAAKRPRLDEAAPERFHLRGNASDMPVDNPSLFKQHPLREEQLRSLVWMMQQESRTSGLKGGLLADKMGFGKTATTIGLLSEDSFFVHGGGSGGRRVARAAQTCSDSYIPAEATLILCPPHLVQQWEDEFFKFLGDDGVQIWRPTPDLRATDYVEQKLACFEVLEDRTAPMGVTLNLDHRVQDIRGAMLALNERTEDSVRALQLNDELLEIIIKYPPGWYRTTSQTINGIRTIVSKTSEFTLKRYDDEFKEFLRPSPGKFREYPRGSIVHFKVRRERNAKPRVSRTRGSGHLRVLAVATNKEHARLQQGDVLQGFGVMIVSTGVLNGEKYSRRIDQSLRDYASSSGATMKTKMSDKQLLLRDFVKSLKSNEVSRRRALREQLPLLEVFWWRRIVLDEFHESTFWKTSTRECVKALSADRRWGLSGTPPLGTTEQVLEVAELFHYPELETEASTMRDALVHIKSRRQESIAWRGDLAKQADLRREAQRFLDGFVRQNTSQLVESIRVVAHEDFIEHTPEERLIYRQSCHDNGLFDLEAGYEKVDLEARAALLQRCAHFSLHMKAADAKAAVRLLGEAKQARIQAVELQLHIEASRAAVLQCWPEARDALCAAAPFRHASAKAFVASLATNQTEDLVADCDRLGALRVHVEREDQQGELRQRPEVRLQQPLKESECYPNPQHRHRVLHEVAKQSDNQEASELLGEHALCEQVCSNHGGDALSSTLAGGVMTIARLLDAAHISNDFFKWQLQGLSTDGEDTKHRCSICLEEAGSLGALAILPCAHVFHTSCVWTAVKQRPKCPECNYPVTCHEVGSVVMELRPTVASTSASPPAPTGGLEELPLALRAHGSKLNKLARRLREIHREDPTAKAIVFVQWAALEKKIAEALRTHEVPCLQLPRRSEARMASTTLERFQAEAASASAPFVLLLSIERVASGTNLTAASHVLFVHPMNADSLSTAVAYERQALGRVRRVGQLRKEVHVWRFVTRHTVEEHIHRLHMSSLADTAAASAGA